MQPTEEQRDILEAARTTSDNLMIVALAGVGKTSTLEMIARDVEESTLFLAFNKRIVEEAKKRLPASCEPRTMNGIGHGVWARTTGKRLTLDADKSHKIVKQLIEAAPRNERDDLYSAMGDTLRWLHYAKRDGYVPERCPYPVRRLVSKEEWLDDHGEEPEFLWLIDEALNRGIQQAWAGNIDFDDQLYMPVCFGGSWPQYPRVLCDEVQDLSAINHVMLEELVFRRLLAVGDPWQSIYAFRGAVQGGMRSLKEKFDMRELPLSYTFRVPKRGVERARSRVPHFNYFPEAPEGHIEDLREWSAPQVKDGAAIICRNNAPLFSCALKLLKDGRNIKLVGMEIGPNLVRLLKKLGPPTLQDMQSAIDDWQQKELTRARKPELVYEKAECLSVLCSGRRTLGEAITYTEDLFRREGSIQLLSAHKAKGLEWDTIYHLDPWRIPSRFARIGTEEYEQELNARYVAETRFKQEMFLVNLEDYR